MESQIQRIADAAAALVKSLPDLEPKQPNAKKKICKELEVKLCFFSMISTIFSYSKNFNIKLNSLYLKFIKKNFKL